MYFEEKNQIYFTGSKVIKLFGDIKLEGIDPATNALIIKFYAEDELGNCCTAFFKTNENFNRMLQRIARCTVDASSEEKITKLIKHFQRSNREIYRKDTAVFAFSV